MSSVTSNFSQGYSESGGTFSPQGGVSSQVTTLDDGTEGLIDNTFEPGEEITFTVVLGGGTFIEDYQGTLNFGGEIFVHTFNGFTHVLNYIGSSSNPTFPSSFTTSDMEYSSANFSYCFAAGTFIATADGEVAVETLKIGDLVRTSDDRTVPVKWLGRQTLAARFSPAASRLVCIKAGSLGASLPSRDLTLTADHALFLGGLLVNAGALINVPGIDWLSCDALGETFTVYHIETDAHDVILAEGVPAETFIDHLDRRAFDNYREYLDIYGDEHPLPALPYPRVSTPRLIPAVLQSRLGAIKAA